MPPTFFGTFSSSTVVPTLERPFEADGPQVFIIGSPIRLAARLEDAIAA